MRSHLPLLALVALLAVTGCADTTGSQSLPTTDATRRDGSRTTSPPMVQPTTVTTTAEATTPTSTTADVGTADRPWDVKVWNRRANAVTVTVRIERNGTGTAVFDENSQLAPDESRKPTIEFPGAGSYTIATTVVGSTATPPTASTTTVSEYSFEIESVPPGYEVIVHLEADGSVTFYKEAA